MCDRCDYPALLQDRELDCTSNRLKVFEIIGNSHCPLSAQKILEQVNRSQDINRVTVYRILDLLVEKKLVERISAGDRSFRYGLAPNDNHRRHAHFYCMDCGKMECLSPESPGVNVERLEQTFPGLIERVEVRLDGFCESCLEDQR